MGTPVATLQLTFDDEFNSFSNSPNGTVGWETRFPYYGSAARSLSANGELEYYSDSSVGANPFSLNGGVLTITASSSASAPNSYKLPYNSGVITTYKSFSQEYGYTETRAQLPAGKGLWSAFWLAPTSLSGQSELDAFEVLGGKPSELYATTHAMINGVFTPNLQLLHVPDTSAGFHVYGIDWEPTTLTWYEDGVAIATSRTPATMNEQMFTLLNLAVGGPWAGTPNNPAGEFPADYNIDYVRSYATAATKYVSGAAGIGLGAPGQASVMGVVAVGLGVGTPLKGVTVTLLDASGAAIASTVSDVHGDYQFTNLDPGAYQLRMATPAGYIPQPGSTGTVGVTLAAGQAGLATTLKLAVPTTTPTTGTVTGTVLLAGASGSAGTAGVSVALLNSAGTSVASTVTSASGVFTFGSVAPGTYTVKYTAPSGEAIKSGPGSASTGLTGALSVVAGQTVTLAAETLAALPATITGSALLGNLGQAGVGVALLNAAGTATLATTTTNASGTFSFTGLAAGTYVLDYTAPAGELLKAGPGDTSTGQTAPVTVAAGQTLTMPAEILGIVPAAIAGSVLLDGAGVAGVVVTLLDASATTTLASTATDAAGGFSFTGLAAGTYVLDYAAPGGVVLQSGPGDASTGQTAPLTVAAGQALTLADETLAGAPASIAGSVLLGASGQAGVAVALLDAAGTTTLATTTTDASGAFSFTGLAAGTYQLDYTPPAGEVLTGGPGSTATGQTAPLTVAAGQTLTLADETLAAAPASIAGRAVFGTNGQAGVAVALLNAAGTATLASTTTDASGAFSFTGLAASTYQLDYTPPAGEVLTGGPGNTTTGQTAPLMVAAGQALTVAAETLASSSVSSGTITGSVKYQGAPQAGTVVTLLDPTGTKTITTTTTNSSGIYQFSPVPVGYYRVLYQPPAGEIIQAGPASPTTGLTIPFGVTAGVTRTMGPVGLAPAYTTLTGTVAVSVFGAGAVGAAGVAVAVVRGSSTVAATTTDANGYFEFDNLVSGTFKVRYTAPSGTVLALGDNADPATGLTAPVTLAPGQTTALPVQDLLTLPGSIGTTVLHYGSGDRGTGQSGVGVDLLDASGATLASTVTDGRGVFLFSNLAAGVYQVRYTAPTGEALSTRGVADPTTGLTAPVTLEPGFNLNLTHESLVSSSNTFTLTGDGAAAVRGNGDYVVSGAASNSRLTLGNGNQQVALTGAGDTVIVGGGTSSISVAGGGATILAGGPATISVTAGGNLLDTGPGASFLSTDGAGQDTFVLNGLGQGLTSIAGYQLGVGNTLDLTNALAGLSVASDLSDVGGVLSAQVAGGNTILSVTPDGGQTSYAVAQLTGTATTVAQLLANHELAHS